MAHYQKTKHPGIYKSKTTIQISFNLANGDRRREVKKLSPTAENLAWASSFRGAIVIAIEKGTFVYAEYFPKSIYLKRKSNKTRRVFIKDVIWKDEVQNPNDKLRKVTLKKYRPGMRIIEEYMGDILISELTRADIKFFAKKMRSEKGVSTKTISNYLLTLRKVVTWGFDRNLITIDPFQNLVIEKTLEEEEAEALNEVDPFEFEEVERIVAVATGQLKNMVQFGFWTGLRLCELFALGWDNVDFEKKVIHVNIDVVEGTYGLTKTRQARTVRLNGPAIEALREQRQHTYSKPPIRIELGKRVRDVRIIFYDDRFDRPFTYTQELLKATWPNLLKTAKVRLRPAKHMRHTYASMSLSTGENEKWVADQLGHTTVEMIRKHYGKWLDGAAERVGRKGGDRLDELIATREETPPEPPERIH